MNNTDLIHLIKHFMRNEHKAVEEVIDSPLSEVANLIKVLQSCQGKVVFIGVGKSGIIARNSPQHLPAPELPRFLFTVRKLYTATLEWWRKTMLLFLFQTVVRRRKSRRHCLV